jgi:hypothetical protein
MLNMEQVYKHTLTYTPQQLNTSKDITKNLTKNKEKEKLEERKSHQPTPTGQISKFSWGLNPQLYGFLELARNYS